MARPPSPYPTHEVYFVHAEQVGMVKIGYATLTHDRIRSMRTNSPVPLILLGIIATSDPEGVEKDLHRRFRHLRSHGEWFRAEPELLDHAAAVCGHSAKDARKLLAQALQAAHSPA